MVRLTISPTQGKSERTQGQPQAIASHTDRGELSEVGREMQDVLAAW